MKMCSIDGCHRKYRCKGYCGLHYSRSLIGRDPAIDPSPPAYLSACSVDNCERPITAKGLCKMHYYRRRNTGDVNHTRRPGVMTYKRAHLLIIKARGMATERSCIDCGKPAHEWSYNHADPDEVLGRNGPYLAAYSLDKANYDPRCRSCHRHHDVAQKRKAKAA